MTIRPARWILPGVVAAATALVAALLTSALLTGAGRAAAGTTGASYGVYVTTGNSEQELSLGNLAGGSSTVQQNPQFETAVTAVNSAATLGVVSVYTDFPVGETEIFSVPGNSILGTLPIAALAYAMDPANPNIAFAVDSAGGVDAINLSSSTSQTITSLSGAATIAATPDGSEVIVGGFSNSFGFIEAVPTNGAAPVRWQGGVLRDEAVQDLTVAPDGSAVYVVGVPGPGFNVPSHLFRLPLANLTPGTRTSWSDPPSNPLAITSPRSDTLSPDGQTVYVAGLNPNGQSEVESFTAASGAGAPPSPIAIATAANGNGGFFGGVNSIGLSPDGKTLLAVGANEIPGVPAQAVLVPVSTAGLTPGPSRALGSGTPTGIEDIAVTPDQAPVANLSPESGTAGVPVTLNASSSNVTYGSIVSYQWNFGDLSSVVTTGGPTVSHVYASQGHYTATVTETDSAGTSIPPAPFTAGAVNGPGTTPYLDASPLARTSAQVAISKAGTPPPPLPTTTTTVKPGASHATLTLDPTVGAPGTIVSVTGKGFPPNKSVKVTWSTNTASFTENTDAHGNLPAHILFILVPDLLGPRQAAATTGPGPALAKAAFLVVPGTAEPGGNVASLLFRSEGP